MVFSVLRSESVLSSPREKIMKIFHASDLHADLYPLTLIDKDVGVVVSSGDFFPNITRGDLATEPKFQKDWFVKHSQNIFRYLAGRPVVVVNGNHDFVCLAEMLVEHGYAGEVHLLTPDKVTEFGGKRWTGHRFVPYIYGEWNGELHKHDLALVSKKLFQHDGVDVLVTHVPPKGILASEWGCPTLSQCFAYYPNAASIKVHMFGHVHSSGGSMTEVFGTKFYNSACTPQIVEIL